MKNYLKNIFCSLFVAILAGCLFLPFDSVNFHYQKPFNICNVYFDEGVYLKTVYYDNKIKVIKDNIPALKLKNSCFFNSGFDYNGHENMTIYSIEAYYKNKSCHMFFYNKDQLLQIRKDSKFSGNDRDVVFLIEKNRLKIVSKKDYQLLKVNAPTLSEKEICGDK